MNTDETKGEYNVEQEAAEAMAMLGQGYETEQPSVVIEPPRRTKQRRGKRMVEVEEAAYVKFSTEFKTELADLDVYALKVFVYIGLSINFDTGTAYPGVRKIAKETKMNKDTVAKAIDELEEKGFLQVWRKDGSSNTYKPECYFAIGETVPSGRTVPEPSGETPQLSDAERKLSDENAKLSDASRVKRAQQDKQDFKQDKPKDILDGILDFHLKPKAIKDAIRDFFRLTPNWEAKSNREFMQWAVSENITAEQVKIAADVYRMDKRFNWTPATLKRIQEHWLELVGVPVAVTPPPSNGQRWVTAEEAAAQFKAEGLIP